MRIYNKYIDIPFKTFTFPDGQPHFELLLKEQDGWEATIEVAITSPKDLFEVLLAKQVMSANGYVVSLDLRYLMGGRMDRAIDHLQPFTLSAVSSILLGAGFRKIRVLDPHSETSLRLLGAERVMPRGPVDKVLSQYDPRTTCLVAPDKGATDRVRLLGRERFHIVQGLKVRDLATGNLSGFEVRDVNLAYSTFLILDDICDGGWTFVGLAKELRGAGAKKVDLFVTHGLFSKGLGALQSLDHIYTTDTVSPPEDHGIDHAFTLLKVDMSKEKSE